MSTLIDIQLSSQAYGVIGQANKLSSSLANELRKISRNAIDEAGLLAVKAYKSSVPIDTGDLRGLGLDNGFIARSRPAFNNIHSSVYIIEGPHYGRKQTPISSNYLAALLNIGHTKKGDLHRTQNSAAIDGFTSIKRGSTTASWEQSAEYELKNQLQSFLNSRDFNY